jgi:hypothetical protein
MESIPVSFWITLLIFLFSLWQAFDDHGESWKNFKASLETGWPKWKHFWKTVRIWAFIALSAWALPVTYSESKSAAKEVGMLKAETPLNRRVTDISASARINVLTPDGFSFTQGRDFDTWVDLLESTNNAAPRTLNLGSFGILYAHDSLVGTSTSATGTNSWCAIEFRPDRTFRGPQEGMVIATMQPVTVAHLVSNINSLQFRVRYIPRDTEIIGGDAEVLINGVISKRFIIYPQKSDSHHPDVGGFVFYATNSPLQSF